MSLLAPEKWQWSLTLGCPRAVQKEKRNASFSSSLWLNGQPLSDQKFSKEYITCLLTLQPSLAEQRSMVDSLSSVT